MKAVTVVILAVLAYLIALRALEWHDVRDCRSRGGAWVSANGRVPDYCVEAGK